MYCSSQGGGSTTVGAAGEAGVAALEDIQPGLDCCEIPLQLPSYVEYVAVGHGRVGRCSLTGMQ